MSFSPPSRARVVIVGGGIVGVSIAYHLARRGCRDVVLVEKHDLTTGATWHAAGLVGQLRSSRNVTRLIQYSVDLYRRLEDETGQSTGWNEVGSLRLASSEERMAELRKIANTGRGFGLSVDLLSPKDARKLFPIADLDGVVGAAYLPSDGYADPSMLTQALARGAREAGAEIIRQTLVEGFNVADGRVRAVHTSRGTIECDSVVNAAGMWARRVGAMAGVNIPVVPLEHQFLVTAPLPGIPRRMPVTRDPDLRVYYRGEVDGLIVGGFEARPLPWNVDGVPWEFTSELIEPNFDQFEPLSENAMRRTPVLRDAGVKELVNGPDGYSPDGAYILGRSPELDNFYVAAGMNCYGIAGAGGVGKALSEWILDGEPSTDLWSLDIRRFGAPQFRSTRHVTARCAEYYPKHYSIAWPMYSHRTSRRLRRSPLHPTLREKRAAFGEKNGWERAQWFAPEAVEPAEKMTFGRPNWHDAVAAEVRALASGVALLDQTSFGKIELEGPDALATLERLATRRLDRPVGSVSYTQLCNSRGGIECDLTVVRHASDRFYLVTGTSFVAHDLDWIRRNTAASARVSVRDSTSSYGVLNLAGPRSRDLLRRVTRTAVENESFPFATAREISIGGARAVALRVSYHGELGWELHVPVEFLAYVYETIHEAGADLELRDVGYRALESCRLEKGFVYWSADVTPDDNPFEAGLGWNVDLGKTDFIGREALARLHQKAPRRRLTLFTLEEPVELFGTEPILAGDEVVGIVTSGGFGHRVAKTVALGYVPADLRSADVSWRISAFGREVGAELHEGAAYDPSRSRMLA